MRTEDVLLFEGVKSRGGRAMLGSRCIRRKRVYSKAMDRNVLRCAQFSGVNPLPMVGLGAFPIDLSQVKDTVMTGAIAVGGAYGARRLGGYVIDALKLDPMSRWRMGIEVAMGLGAGFFIGKYTGKPDLGAAIAIGPVVINGMELVGEFLVGEGPAIAGADQYSGAHNNPALGVAVEQGQLPGWATPSRFVSEMQEQYPSWATG